MIHGYHVILPMYGFWLPNDPRGSWSSYVGSWELLRFGRTTRTLDQRRLDQLTPEELASRDAARQTLKFPPVSLSGQQALSIGLGFGEQVRTSGLTIWACSILPEHTHLVIARHRYSVEQVVNLLKGAATRRLIEGGLHPLARFAESGKTPHVWATGLWKSFLDTNIAIENAINYVLENPTKEGKPEQRWSFVSGFSGVDSTGPTTYGHPE